MSGPSREWLMKMADAEDKCGGIFSVGGLVTRFKQTDENEQRHSVDSIDVEEAKNLSECCDCTAGIYVYNNGDYPQDTGPICFQCLRRRYEVLRDTPKLRRVDTEGRDVTELTGLWDESDSLVFKSDSEFEKG